MHLNIVYIIFLSQQHTVLSCKLQGAWVLLYYGFRHNFAEQTPELLWAS